jgi:hypothetical protein
LNAAQALDPGILQALANYLPGAVEGAAGPQLQKDSDQGVALQLPRQVEHHLDVIANQVFNKLGGDVRNNLYKQVNNVTNNILNRFDAPVQGNVLNQINNVGNDILNRPNDNNEINRLTILNNVTSNVLNSINKQFGGNDNTPPIDGPALNNLFANDSVQYSGASALNY